MRIAGLGVIDEAVLELGPGLTVVTGETGAGKTMVVQGLALLFGGRADAALVRSDAERGVVEGRLALAPDHPAVARALEAGAELDDGALIVSRTVTSEGRSRAHLGGRSVPAAVLAEIGSDALAMHGQSDQQRLLRADVQRAALDRFAGPPVLEPLASYRDAFRRWRAVERELDELVAAARERERETELLRAGLAEIDAAEPQPGEADALKAEAARLGNADALRTAAALARTALAGDEAGEPDADVLGLINGAARSLQPTRHDDPALAALATRLDELSALAGELAIDLAGYVDGIEADPARLAAVHDRLAVLTALVRRYGGTAGTLDEVLTWADRARERLAALDGADDRITALTAERDDLVTAATTLAQQLSEARAVAADRFAAAVTEELTALAMPHARVTVALTTRPGVADRPSLRIGDSDLLAGADGVDDVELLLAPHPGAPARPLHRGASGGELSRVMLAVEVVFADADSAATYVFDEVDAGVGGRAAVEVGRRLARLARTSQVLVVTHLPQVAAFADHHLVVEKASDGLVTRSGVSRLDSAGRVRELSRMLAGVEDSELAQGHAEELLEAAEADRRPLASRGTR